MRRYLNDDIGSRKINSRISYFRKKNRVHLISSLEILKNSIYFFLRNLSMNKRSSKYLSNFFNDENRISKNNNLVPSFLVEIHEILTSHQFIRIGNIYGLLLNMCCSFFMLKKILLCHVTLNFKALNSG